MSKTPKHLEMLKSEFEKRVAKNSRCSLRSYAKTLGIHPSALSRVLALKADLTPLTGVEIAKRLNFSANDSRRFVCSILEARNRRERVKLAELLGLPNLSPPDATIALDNFALAIDSTKIKTARERLSTFLEELAHDLEVDVCDAGHHLSVALKPVHEPETAPQNQSL